MPAQTAPQQAQKKSPVVEPQQPRSDASGKRVGLKGLSYDQQKDALRPKGSPAAPAKGEKPEFDQWKLSPEVKALFVELGQTSDDKRMSEIVKELTAGHGVPQAVVDQILFANRGFFKRLFQAAKKKGWRQVNLDEQGNISSVFQADQKKLSYVTQGTRTDINYSKGGTFETKGSRTDVTWKGDPTVRYTDKDGGWDAALTQKKKAYGGDKALRGEYGTGTEKDGRTVYGGEVGLGKGKTYVGGGYKHVQGKDRTEVEGRVHVGDKKGVSGEVKLADADTSLSVSGDATRLSKDGTTTDTLGGASTYTFKKKGDGGKVPKQGDVVTIGLKGRVTRTAKQSGDGNTVVQLGGNFKDKSTTVSADYTGDHGTAGGKGYKVDQISAAWSERFNLDEAAKRGLTLSVNGAARMTDKAGEENTFHGEVKGTWTRAGEKGGNKALSLGFYGGYEHINTISKMGYQRSPMLMGDQSYGKVGRFSLAYKNDKTQIDADVTAGDTGKTSLLGGSARFKFDKKYEANIWASVAKQDGKVATLIRATTKIRASKGVSFEAGGEHMFIPGEAEHTELWSLYAGAGIKLAKDHAITVKMGIAGDGSQISYIPEATYKWDKKLSVTAMANLNKTQNTYGAKIDIAKTGISVFGGYGDMNALTNVYTGNAGMTMPGMGRDDVLGRQQGGGFVGVQFDLIKIGKKLFGK